MKGEFMVASANGVFDYAYFNCALKKAKREAKKTKYVEIVEIKRDEIGVIKSCKTIRNYEQISANNVC